MPEKNLLDLKLSNVYWPTGIVGWHLLAWPSIETSYSTTGHIRKYLHWSQRNHLGRIRILGLLHTRKTIMHNNAQIIKEQEKIFSQQTSDSVVVCVYKSNSMCVWLNNKKLRRYNGQQVHEKIITNKVEFKLMWDII